LCFAGEDSKEEEFMSGWRILILVVLSALAAGATTIDFESNPVGTYTSLVFPEVVITYTGGTGEFQVYGSSPGPPLAGHNIISSYNNPGPAPFRADFLVGGITHVMIAVGDYNADVDNSYLAVYDAADNLLATDYYMNPAPTYGGGFLEVFTATPIAYALFWDEEPFPGAVYWDNLTFEGGVIPEPGTFVLAGGALVALALLRLRR
jgi:hypothetical protein